MRMAFLATMLYQPKLPEQTCSDSKALSEVTVLATGAGANAAAEATRAA
jgi:hypothetical protein